MPHHESVGSAGKPPIRDQSHLVAKTSAHDRGRRAQHFAHPWTSLRALVPNDHDVALAHSAIEYRGRRSLLAIEDSRHAGEDETLLAADLAHCALGCHISIENHEMTVRLQRLGQWAHDILA